MALPAPDLDDRRFQDLVDEARRLVQERCAAWTDHNVSDPGITLIEAFAFMVEQLLYRLNRVTDLHYLRYLDLIGVRLFPPTPARCDLTFRLSAARPQPVTVPKGTHVAGQEPYTANGEPPVDKPVVFTTVEDLVIVPCSLAHLYTGAARSAPVYRGAQLAEGTGVGCFSDSPRQGDAVYFGLSTAVPRCTVLLRLDCEIAGPGVDPRDPPLEWQYWKASAGEWAACEVGPDTTGGLTADGDVEVHVPGDHGLSVVGEHQAGWLRCRVVESRQGQPKYTATPRITAVTARTIGGSVPAYHCDIVTDEILGTAEGVPGQRLAVLRPPIVSTGEKLVVRVLARGGPQEWTEVDTFAYSGPGDRHVMVDRVAGEIVFGPAVRQEDGSLRRYGDVPEKGALIKVPRYLTGGGQGGNVARHVLTVQREPVPFVTSVINRKAALGGVDAESVANAAARGPLQLRIRDRAVTAEDYEQLARGVAPEVARIRCVPVQGPDDRPSEGVRVLIVPHVPYDEMLFENLRPTEETLRKIVAELDARRCLGARVLVEPPYYQGVTVVAELRARAGATREAVRARAKSALYAYLNPITGGQYGTGWAFGHPVQSGEVHAVLQRVDGVELVDDILLFEADPVTGQRGEPVQRIALESDALVFSYGHQIKVEH